MKFYGNVVAHDEAGYGYIEVVDGKNIYSYSDLQSSNNNILLQNIQMSQDGSFALQSGKTLWGNGFEFDVTQGINNN